MVAECRRQENLELEPNEYTYIIAVGSPESMRKSLHVQLVADAKGLQKEFENVSPKMFA